MICLNKKLPVDMEEMKKVFIKELDVIIEHKLYYLDVMFPNLKNDIKNDENIYNDKIKKFKNNILKEFKSKFDSDNFIYRIIDQNHCTFKHEKGKNEGKFCCKKITKNGNKKKFICRIHNKDHIPKKKIKLHEYETSENIEKTKNNRIISDKVEIYHDKINGKIVDINNDKKNIEKNRNIRKNNENFRNKNIYINKFNINSFRKKINYHKDNISNYIIYNNKKYFNNKPYKHNITLADFIPQNLLSY